MSHGATAQEGFLYQSAAILELCLEAFAEHGDDVRARPEGMDDLVLAFSQQAVRHRFIQIKKSTTTLTGDAVVHRWSIADVVTRGLVAEAIKKATPGAEQVWLLGDPVDPSVAALLDAGASAPTSCPDDYLALLHLAARREGELPGTGSAGSWRPPTTSGRPVDAQRVLELTQQYGAVLTAMGVEEPRLAAYQAAVNRLHQALPSTLSRVTLRDNYGTLADLRARLRTRLADTYGLDPDLVSDHLYRNLRGYIADVSVQHGKWIVCDDLDAELLTVWSRATPVRLPPGPPVPFVLRDALLREIVDPSAPRILVLTGVSGSGKTALAGELVRHCHDHERPAWYVEVRDDTTLRDVFVGLGFHLRRWDRSAAVARRLIDGQYADEDALRDAGLALSQFAEPGLVVLDFVDGQCSDAFARLLAALLRSWTTGGLRLVGLAQVDVLRDLGALERRPIGAQVRPLPGLGFPEFVDLARVHSSSLERAALHRAYDAVSAGRESGVTPRLALALLAMGNALDDEMLAKLDPILVMEHADRRRFEALPQPTQEAGWRLACFALPFDTATAASLFPWLPVRRAVVALAAAGLVEPRDEGTWEMHEVVRRGIEALVPEAVLLETHRALADALEGDESKLTARIHHLGRAGGTAEGDALAKRAFLSGEHAFALAPYVTSRGLVGQGDLIRLIAEGPRSAAAAALSILPSGDRVAGERLLAAACANPGQLKSDYQRARVIAHAVAITAPDLVPALLDTALSELPDEPDPVWWVCLGLRNAEYAPNAAVAAWFDGLGVQQQNRTARVLLLTRDVAVLRRALDFYASKSSPLDDLYRPTTEDALHVFLRAMPMVEPGLLVHLGSIVPAALESWLWAHRDALRGPCRAVAARDDVEDGVREAALVVLTFIGDEQALPLCAAVEGREGALGTRALFLQMVMAGRSRLPHHVAAMTNPELDLGRRVAHFIVCSALGQPMGELLDVLQAGEDAESWRFFALLACGLKPFAECLPLAREAFDHSVEGATLVATAAVNALARVPSITEDPAWVDTLVAMLGHREVRVRMHGMQLLARTRSRRALPEILRAARSEGADVGKAVSAILASGPTRVADIAVVTDRDPRLLHWRFTLAGRLSDANEAERLVAAILARATHWQLRRAALLASARLPYEAVLEYVAGPVLAETPSLPDDASLTAHGVLASLLSEGLEPSELKRLWSMGRAGFVEFMTPLLTDLLKQQVMRGPSTTAPDVASECIWERLDHHGFAATIDALDRVVDEVHRPTLHGAVLRGLRMAERLGQLEAVIRDGHYEWLRLRALIERGRAAYEATDVARWRALAAAGGMGDAPSWDNVLSTLEARKVSPAPPAPTNTEPSVRHLDGAAALAAANGHEFHLDDHAVVVIEADPDTLVTLCAALDPRRESGRSERVPGSSRLTLRGDGRYTVGDTRRSVSTQAGRRTDAALLSATAAAHAPSAPPPWHHELLSGPLASGYAADFLKALGARADREAFVAWMVRDGEVILQALTGSHAIWYVRELLAPEILSPVSRLVHAGTEQTVEVLAELLRWMDDPAAVPVMTRLFERAVARLRPTGPAHVVDVNSKLWRVVLTLGRSPRFREIPGWDERIMEFLIGRQVPWVHKRSLIDLLRASPAAYVRVELELFRAWSFAHYWRDDVDHLDDLADELFGKTRC